MDYIPFINGKNDCDIAAALYGDAVAMRVSLESFNKIGPNLPQGPKRWIDASIDGLHQPKLEKLTDTYRAHVQKFAGFDRIADPGFQLKPDKGVVRTFAYAVLDSCLLATPDWISVPQLPLFDNSSRNKINRLLAENTSSWKQDRKYVGKLILPAVFTNQRQLNRKTERNQKIAGILQCLSSAGGDGVWTVDSTLNDQDGSNTFAKRFASLVNLHEELNGKLPEFALTITGPYWGMNLVLWVRGLARFAAIGLGNSYRYSIPGSPIGQANIRIALAPLRRWAVVDPKLRQWLAQAASTLSPTDPAAAQFSSLEKDFSKFVGINGRKQVASFYKDWFQKFGTLPMAARALALFQDLSTAYVVGSALGDLPEKEGTARDPAKVAQQFMMNCL